MKKKLLLSLFAGFLALGLSIPEAEARRLGGGKSFGFQRSITPKQATPQQAAPAQTAPAPSAVNPPKRSWMGPIAGLAAGIGLAALLSHFGLGEGVANFLMILLLAVAAVFVIRLLLRRASPSGPATPVQFAGAGGQNFKANSDLNAGAGILTENAGRSSALQRNIPADFDVEAFLRIAKVQFLRLQAANDAGNLVDIREFTTPEMYAELKLDIDDRRGTAQLTDVISLEAELLEVFTEADRHVASVRFHGHLREEQEAGEQAFDEVWNLVKPVDGSRGWALAGIQQLA